MTEKTLVALQNYITVEGAVPAVGGEAGHLAEGKGNGARQLVDFLVGGVVAEAVDARGMLPSEQIVARPEGRQAVTGASLGGNRIGFGCQLLVV